MGKFIKPFCTIVAFTLFLSGDFVSYAEDNFAVFTSMSGNAVKISWNKAQNAESYKVYRRLGKSVTLIGETSKECYTDFFVNPAKVYGYSVVANCSKNGKRYTDNTFFSYIKTSAFSVIYENPVLTVVQNSGSAVFGWQLADSNVGIEFESRTDATNWKSVSVINNTAVKKATIGSLNYNTQYYFRARYFTTYNGCVNYSTFSSIYKVLFKVGKPLEFSVAAYNCHSVKLRWLKAENSSGYIVYRSGDSGYKAIGKTANCYFYDKTAVPGTDYKYRILPYMYSKGKYYYGSYSVTTQVKTKLNKPVLDSETSVSYSRASFSWDKISGATGYCIYKRSPAGSWKYCGSTKKLCYTIKGLTIGKTYYVKVKAYLKLYGKKYYSPYSSVKKLKPALKNPGLAVALKGTYIKVCSKSVKGASGYKLYISSSTSSWRLYKTINSKNGFSVKVRGYRGKTVKFKTRAFRTIKGKRYYSKYSQACSVKIPAK